METFFRHYRALALLIDQHFPAHSRPLFHVHVHSSFLMGVSVLVRPFLRTGFHPAFTLEKARRFVRLRVTEVSSEASGL